MESRYLISCDWGTSAFRLRLVEGRPDPEMLAERSTADGILAFQPARPDAFERHLAAAIDALFGAAATAPEPAPVYLSGMVTSSLGWKELPYARLPFPLDGSAAVVERAVLERRYGAHPLLFISGVRSDDDVLRGEETELIGLLSRDAERSLAGSCVTVLPGTHSKAIEVEAGRVTGFRTCMTGELFQVLQRSSILRHSVEAPAGPGDPGNPFFERGVRRAARDGLLASLFTVRAGTLIEGIDRGSNAHYLSGLLIGSEVASIVRRHVAPRPILVGGNASLQALYLRALDLLGAGARVRAAPEEVTSLAATLGHWSLRAQLERRRAP